MEQVRGSAPSAARAGGLLSPRPSAVLPSPAPCEPCSAGGSLPFPARHWLTACEAPSPAELGKVMSGPSTSTAPYAPPGHRGPSLSVPGHCGPLGPSATPLAPLPPSPHTGDGRSRAPTMPRRCRRSGPSPARLPLLSTPTPAAPRAPARAGCGTGSAEPTPCCSQPLAQARGAGIQL